MAKVRLHSVLRKNNLFVNFLFPIPALLVQEEGPRELRAPGGGRGALGGRAADPVPLRQAQPRAELRAGHERDYRADLLRLRLGPQGGVERCV